MVWAGGRDYPDDWRRSISFGLMAPRIARHPGVSWISLQKGEPTAQAAGVPGLHQWMDKVQHFADTAAILAHLDLVISVDTAVVHLTGAMTRPLWLLNRYGSDWRWMSGREDSPWYPTVRIFQQACPLEWRALVSRVDRELFVWQS